MVSPTFLASVLTLVPAMGAAAFILNRYEGYFEQSRLFFAIIVGMFAGIVVKALEVNLFPFDFPPLLVQGAVPPYSLSVLAYSFVATVSGFALVAALAMAAVLGFSKFRARKDAPYYGVALGLAMGAMWGLQSVALFIFQNGGLHLTFVGLAAAIEYLFVGSGIVLAHGAAGAWIGHASANGTLKRGALHGMVWLMPLMALYWAYELISPGLLLAAALAAGGVGMMLLASRRVLDRIVPLDIQEQVRRQKRRQQRRGK